MVMDVPVTSASDGALSMNTAGAEVSTMKAALCAGPAPIVGSGLTARTSKAWLPSPSVAPPSEAEETVALGAAPHAVHGAASLGASRRHSNVEPVGPLTTQLAEWPVLNVPGPDTTFATGRPSATSETLCTRPLPGTSGVGPGASPTSSEPAASASSAPTAVMPLA